jgi:hypothetical protein
MSRISRRSLLATTGLGILTGGLRRVFGIESTSDSQADKTAAESRNEPLALAQYQPVSQISGHRFPYSPDFLGTSSQWCFPGSGTHHRRSIRGTATRHGAQEHPCLN